MEHRELSLNPFGLITMYTRKSLHGRHRSFYLFVQQQTDSKLIPFQPEAGFTRVSKTNVHYDRLIETEQVMNV